MGYGNCVKLLLDMNLSSRWVSVLRAAGLDAAHWSTVRSPTARDTEIVMYAAQNGYVVGTHDLDFSAILAATGDESPCVVQVRSDDLSPDVIGKRVITSLKQMISELEAGALLSIDCNRSRLRLLPLTVTSGSSE